MIVNMATIELADGVNSVLVSMDRIGFLLDAENPTVETNDPIVVEDLEEVLSVISVAPDADPAPVFVVSGEIEVPTEEESPPAVEESPPVESPPAPELPLGGGEA